MPAKFSEIIDDLTGQLSGGAQSGGRAAADPYIQTLGPGSGPQGTTFAPAPSMMQKPGGPVSPFSSVPPVQLATSPMAQARMMAPMDPSMSVQQAMAQQAAMEGGNGLRPPYTQPYGPAAYGAPGFQGAPVSALQAPVYGSQDTCSGPATQLRTSPAQQMQMIQQQRMAQLQAQQAQSQSAMQQQAQCQAMMAKKHPAAMGKSPMTSGPMAAAAAAASEDAMYRILVITIIVLLVVLLLLALVFGILGSQRAKNVEFMLRALAGPIGRA